MSLSLEGVDCEIVEARNLLAADKGGTSDPFAQVILLDSEHRAIPKETYRTKAWKRTLVPQWNESFKLGDDTLPSVLAGAFIEVRVFDEDKGLTASNDPLGIVKFPLKLLAKKNKLRVDAWFPLLSTPAMEKAGIMATGEVRLRCKLLGDTSAIYAELKEEASGLSHEGMMDARTEDSVDEAHAKLYADKTPNELHIQLLRAHDLPVMDKAMLMGKGSSDPFVKFECLGASATSSTKKKSLNPEWNEAFVLSVDDPKAVLEVWMYDYDLASAPDFMGCFQIPLDNFLDKLRHNSDITLLDDKGVVLPPSTGLSSAQLQQKQPPLPRLELTLWWKYNPELDVLLEMDLSDELIDEEVELEAQAEDAKMRKIKRKEANELLQVQMKVEAERLLKQNKHQQYLDDMSNLQEEYSDLLEENKLQRVALWEELNDLEPGQAYDNDVLNQRQLEPNYITWEEFEIQHPETVLEPPKEVSFESWSENLELKELDILLQSSGIQNQSAKEFVELYRGANPAATILDIIELVRNDVVENKEEKKTRLNEMRKASLVLEDQIKTKPHKDDDEDENDEEKQEANQAEEDEDDDFDPNDPSTQSRLPNELCVCVVRGRGLLPVERTLTGIPSSDPLVALDLEGFSATTASCPKNLNPLWKEVLRLPLPLEVVNPSISNQPYDAEGEDGTLVQTAGDDDEDDDDDSKKLMLTVEDTNLVGANEFMGKVAISLKNLTSFWSAPKWHKLNVDNETGDSEGVNKLLYNTGMKKWEPFGAVEIRLRWRFNPDLVEPPLFPQVTKYETLKEEDYHEQSSSLTSSPEPNQLIFTLWRGRKLPIMDRNLIGGGGTSDPLVRFKLLGEYIESSCKKKTLSPEWGESWKINVEAQDAILEVILEDKDSVSQNDFMGQVKIPLCKYKNRGAVRSWFCLGDKKGRAGGCGDLDIQLRWFYNPGLIPEEFLMLDPGAMLKPPKGETAANKDKPRNELLVTVVRAKYLLGGVQPNAASGISSAGGSFRDDSRGYNFNGFESANLKPVCPQVKLSISDGGDEATTSVKKKDFDPIWIETMKLSCPQDPGAALTIRVHDFISPTKQSFIGKVNIPLDPLASGHPIRSWYTLGNEKTGFPDGAMMRGAVEVCLRWKHNPQYAEGEPLVETEDDEYPDKVPNELRVGVIRARKLQLIEKTGGLFSKGGGLGKSGGKTTAGDPFIAVTVVGAGGRSVMSPVRKKTINPRWNWRCCLSASPTPPNTSEDAAAVRPEAEEVNELGMTASSSKKKNSKKNQKNKKANKLLTLQNGLTDQVEDHGLYLEVVISNYNNNGKDHAFLGRTFIYIDSMENLKRKKPVRAWYPLAPQPKGKYLKQDGARYGEIELLLKWVYNPDVDFSDFEQPYVAEADPCSLMKPNELAVAVLGSSNLLVREKNMFDSTCRSDLKVLLRAGSSDIRESSTKLREFDPTWNEKFVLSADEFTTTFELFIEDTYDEDTSRSASRSGSRHSSRPESRVSSRPQSANVLATSLDDKQTKHSNAINPNANIIGRGIVNLTHLLNKQPRRVWMELLDQDGNAGKNGKIEIILKWRFNPMLIPEELKLDPEETEEALLDFGPRDLRLYGVRLPNELHVMVVRTASLKSPLSSEENKKSSNQNKLHPFVRLSLPGQKKGTVSIGSTMVLNNQFVWCDRFVSQELPYASRHILRAEVIERNAVGTTSSEVLPGDRLIGVVELPIAGLMDRAPQRSWFRLSDIKGAKAASSRMMADLDKMEDNEENDRKTEDIADEKDQASSKKASAAQNNSTSDLLDLSSGYDTSPDCGRIELWMRYAYNPEYDPSWVPAPIMVDMPTCTSTDLPSLDAFGRPPPQFAGIGVALPNISGLGNLNHSEQSNDREIHDVEPTGLETPRWFFLETPRVNEDDEDMFSQDTGVGCGPSDPIPHGPYNELGLKELFDLRVIHNHSRVWTEGMGEQWSEIDEIPVLKRKLWAYPDPPTQSAMLDKKETRMKPIRHSNPTHPQEEGEAGGHVEEDPEEMEEYDEVANERWFFVAETKDKQGKPTIVGPETKESMKSRFEENGSAGGLGGPRIYDGTMAWREGLSDWLPIGDLPEEEGIGRNAGWKPRREQNGIPLPRFDLSMECCKCGSVAELHCIDALALNKDHEKGNNNTSAVDDDVDYDDEKNGENQNKDGFHFRSVPPSGRVAKGSDPEGVSFELLPDFLWIGGQLSATRSSLRHSEWTHVINCTEDLEDCLEVRDLTAPIENVVPRPPVSDAAAASNALAVSSLGQENHHHHHHQHHHRSSSKTSMCYYRLSIPDIPRQFEEKYGTGMWLDSADWDYFDKADKSDKQLGGDVRVMSDRKDEEGELKSQLAVGEDEDEEDLELEAWNAIKSDRRKFGPDERFWLKMFDQCYDFIESAERVNGHLTRVLLHGQRGNLRPCIIATSYVLRKFGLTCAEALNAVSKQLDGADVIAKFAMDGPEALSGLITNGATSALLAYEKKYTIGRLFCETCFDEFRFGEEDTALSMVADAAARRLLAGDYEMVDLDLRGEPLLSHDNKRSEANSSHTTKKDSSIVDVLSDAIKKTSCALMKLNLSGCHLGDRGVTILCKGIRHTDTILITCLQYNNIGDSGAKAIAQLIAGKFSSSPGTGGDLENKKKKRELKNRSETETEELEDNENEIGEEEEEEEDIFISKSKSLSKKKKKKKGGGGGGHSMTFLDLGFNVISFEGAQYLSKALKTNETLTSLHLNSNQLGDLGGEVLAKALCDPEYEVYEESVILGAAAAETARIEGKSEKVALGLSKRKQEKFLQLHRRNNGLTHLNLCSNHLGQKTTEVLTQALLVHQTLSILELSFNPELGNTEVKKMTNAIRTAKPPLEYLSIGQMVLGDDIAGLFAKILDPKHDAEVEHGKLVEKRLEEKELELKEFGSIQGKSNDIVVPKVIWKPCSLKQLHLPRNRLLSTSAFKLSSALLHNSSLTTLSLPQNPIGPKGAEHISNMLLVNKSLKSLDLEGCGLNELGAAHIGNSLKKNHSLTSLELSENHLSAHGVRRFCECFVENKTLLKLNLHNVRGGIIGAEYLSKSLLKDTCGLTQLGFSNNHIKNMGAMALAPALSQNVKLKYVDLGFNNFDVVGGTKIINALLRMTEPGCDIEHKTLPLHLILNGNEGCEELVSPYLARAKVRWDFLSATKNSKLASDTGSYPLAKTFIDPKVRAAYRTVGREQASAQGGLF